MNFYTVTLIYTATNNIRVEAQSWQEAEKLAWQELASDGSWASEHGEWVLDGISEDKPQEAA